MLDDTIGSTTLIPALDKFPRTPLVDRRTAIDRATRLGAKLGIDLRIKRDDTIGLMLGGNKVRQLEYYFGAAEAEGADSIVITGAVQSNFVRLASAAARRKGWKPVVQLEDRVLTDCQYYKNGGNALLDRILGAEIHHFGPGDNEAAADARLDEIAAELRSRGHRPYVIHLGADHPPLGALGYVAAAAEIWDQMAAMDGPPDAVVLGSGSGLTHVGTLVGLRLLGWTGPVHGICVRRSAPLQRARILQRSTELAEMLGAPDLIRESDVLVDDTLLAPGYGQINREIVEAIALAAQSEALLLDPIYTGRVFAGLRDLVAKRAIASGARVLFIHTGGTPGVFAYTDQLTDGVRDLDAVPSAAEAAQMAGAA